MKEIKFINIEAQVQKDWGKITKEKITVEYICGVLYGFGSELATLRLLKEYKNSESAYCGYSKNMKSFYFRLDTKINNLPKN